MIGATGRSTRGYGDVWAPGATTPEHAASHAAATTNPIRARLTRRAPSAPPSTTSTPPGPRRQQHRDDRHAVHDLAVHHHPEDSVERKGLDVDELRLVRRRLRAAESLRQEQVRSLVDHALARVVGAEGHEAPGAVPDLLGELALRGLLDRLAGVHAAGRHLPGRAPGDV